MRAEIRGSQWSLMRLVSEILLIICKRRAPALFAAALFLLSYSLKDPVFAKCPPQPKEGEVPCSPKMTKAEQYVLQQIASGETANLAEAFPAEDDRVLRGCFVRML